MNMVSIEPISRTVEIQSFFNSVTVEVIRIYSDYYFMTYSQTTSVDKEV